MKQAVISKCEQEFIVKGILEGKRLDGRHTHDYRYRKINVEFGNELGLCQVAVGPTKVLARVMCEVVAPKPSRPNEGFMFLNVDLSPMAAAHFESGRLSEYGLEINRLLERCLKDSHAVDVESLCIVGGEKVWCIRVNVTVLNNDGNIMDCVSIAAIAALAHFRRPDVTVSGEEVTIHTLQDKIPVPLSIHHWPVCITFGFFGNGSFFVVDPTEREERVMEGKMVLGMNVYREVCSLHLSGTVLNKGQILRCAQIAAAKTAEIVEIIKSSLALDAEKREKRAAGHLGEPLGFVQGIQQNLIQSSEMDTIEIPIVGGKQKVVQISRKNDEAMDDDSVPVTVKGAGTAQIGEGGYSTWTISDDDDEDEENDIIEITHPAYSKERRDTELVDLDDSDEEKEVITLDSSDLDYHVTS